MKKGIIMAALLGGTLAVQAKAPMEFYPAPKPGAFQWDLNPHSATVENHAIKLAWDFEKGVSLNSLSNRYLEKTFPIDTPLFTLHYRMDGKEYVLDSGNCHVSSTGALEREGKPEASCFAKRLPGQNRVVNLDNEHLSASIVIDAGDDANYVRETITFTAKQPVTLERIELFPALKGNWQLKGSVRGVPFVKNDCFLSSEHPSSTKSKTDRGQTLGLGIRLAENQSWSTSTVVGVAPEGQLRRGFLYYVERERAHPFHVFPHYNNWMVTCFADHPYDEATVRDTIRNWGEQFIVPYGVKIETFALDDGWDDCHNSMWKFHNERFPNGFKPLGPLVKKYDTSLGIWISPAGGYQNEGKARREYAKEHGLANTEGKLSLAYPPYYDYFLKTTGDILVDQDVNYFKIDKLGGVEELNRAKQIFEHLRSIRPDIFINLTVDSWPSPFWLRVVDSLWRGGSDTQFADVPGSKTRQWIAYRDGIVHQNVVQKSPLYPVSSLMVHGLILAKLGRPEQFMDQSDADFRDQAQSFVCSGINCEELYIDYHLMTPERWAFLAKLLKWSRANQNILVDVHWVGGDPFKVETYGWAAWSPDKSILTLRNPSDKPVVFHLDPRKVFELPASETGTLSMKKLWAKDAANQTFECGEDGSIELEIGSMQTITWEGTFKEKKE